jgi:uncharacterized protein
MHNRPPDPALPEIIWETEPPKTDGDTVVALSDAEGTALDGIPYRNTYAWFLRLRDDRIIAASAFFDSLAFNDLRQRVEPGPAS